MRVHLTYYKVTGRFVCGASYVTQLTRHDELELVWDEVRAMARRGKLPGLVDGHGRSLIISVRVPTHPDSHPRLIMPLYREESTVNVSA